MQAGANQSFASALPTTLEVTGGTLDLAGGGTARTLSFAGTAILSGGTLNGGSGGTKGTLEVGGNLVSSGTMLCNSPNITMSSPAGTTYLQGAVPLTGVGTFTKTGSGTVQFNQQIAGSLVVVNQGTLLLGSDNRIASGTDMRLVGATFATGGFSQNLNNLTLTADSIIDFGSGASVLAFNSASGWTSGSTLTIVNWSGDYLSGGSTDRLLFGANNSGYLNQVQFKDPFGLPPGIYPGRLIGPEVVPVPEPATWCVLVLLAIRIAKGEIDAIKRVIKGIQA